MDAVEDPEANGPTAKNNEHQGFDEIVNSNIGESVNEENNMDLQGMCEHTLHEDPICQPTAKEQEGVAKFDSNHPEVIIQGKLSALLTHLTSAEIVDYSFICDFFLTYRIVASSNEVMDLLLTRLFWSFECILTESERMVGKIVLMRLFVVLRHWILNYFVDDFESDAELCDKFVNSLNEIPTRPYLCRNDMVLERKIVSDLKTHWLMCLREFKNFDIDSDRIDVFSYRIPLMNDIKTQSKSKRSTNMSLYTNPSYRRSAMLSLYDNNIPNRFNIHQDKIQNGQTSEMTVDNLLFNHSSTRTSIAEKLSKIVNGHRKLKRKPMTLSNRHNHMNIKNTSLDLKKVSNMNQDSITTPSSRLGFSSNGGVKLPDSEVKTILPPTPVKKMEEVISTNVRSHFRDSKKSMSSNDDHTEILRKKSLRKMVDGWKKPFVQNRDSNNLRSTFSRNSDVESLSTIAEDMAYLEINGRSDILSARIVDEFEYLIRFYINTPLPDTMNTGAKEDNDSDQLKDVSSFDDDFETSKHFWTVKITGGENKLQDTVDIQNAQDINLNDLSELNISKIDNLVNFEDFKTSEVYDTSERHSRKLSSQLDSFQRPASIDWNETAGSQLERSVLTKSNATYTQGIDSIDYSGSMSNAEEPFKTNRTTSPGKSISMSKRTSTQYFDTESGEVDTHSHENENSLTSQSYARDIHEVDDEVADLSIKRSPTTNFESASDNILNPALPSSRKISLKSRSSTNSIFKQESIKSYVSYDSALSVLMNHKVEETEDFSTLNLKKKHAFSNLRDTNVSSDKARKQSEDERFKVRSFSATSFVSKSSSLRKSIRFNSLCALSKNDYFQTRLPNKSGSNISRSSNIYGADDSSIFSFALVTTKDSFKDTSTNAYSDTSINSAVIPGISNYALKELAAIPDESYHNDPVKFALRKLEGRNKGTHSNNSANNSVCADRTDLTDALRDRQNGVNKKSQTISENPMNNEIVEYPVKRYTLFAEENNMPLREKPSQEQDESVDIFNNTEEILDEINNANTQDVIDVENSFEEISQEAPLATSEKVCSSDKVEESSFVSPIVHESPSMASKRNSFKSPCMILDNYSLSSDRLKVENVLQNDVHVSYVLGSDSKTLSIHFTAIEQDLLQEIDWKELIELKWNKELTPVNSWLEVIVNDEYYRLNRGVNLVIARFNLMVNWIISEILLTGAQKERINLISRFIHIAQNCLVLQNFATLMQVILALSSEKIQKLKETWKQLAPGDILILKNLEELSSPLKNFLNLRLCINQIKPSRGCIPFAGLYLSDLIFNTERPTIIKSKKPSSALPVSVDDKSQSASIQDTDYDEKLINFSKFRTSVHIVRSLSQCIEWSNYYDLPIDDELISKCLYINSLDEVEMNQCLAHLSEASN